MPIIRIISLGEVTTQHQMKTLHAFATLINPSAPASAMPIIGKILQDKETQDSLNQFKLGLKTEEEFKDEMIAKIKAAANVELTVEDFYKAWNAMNLSFAEFSPLLAEVCAEHRDDQQLIFVSFSNPIDIRHLTHELKSNGFPCTVDDSGNLTSIGGIPLHLTYIEKKTKAELILEVFNRIKAPRVPAGAGSLGPATFFAGAGSHDTAVIDIKYIRGIQSPSDPILKDLSDKDRASVEATTTAAGIETLLWQRHLGQHLHDVICGTESHIMLAAKL